MDEVAGELADLRRRVYGPAATDDDRRRYTELLAQPVAAPEPAPAPVEPVAPRRRRRWPFVAGGVAVLVAVAVIAALQPSARPARAPEVLPTSAEQRSTIVNALVIGTKAGIAAYLMTNREPPEIQQATFVYTVEKRGTGPGTVTLLPGGPLTTVEDVYTGRTIGARGRATVLLTVAQSGIASWRAQTGTGTVAARGGWQAAGSITSATFAYGTGRRPIRLSVQVPANVPWGAAVVYTN